MNIEPFLLAATLRVLEAQRLIRRLCKECKQPYVCTTELAELHVFSTGETIYRPGGCNSCRGTGYRGRVGIFEMLRTDEGVRQLCIERASTVQIVSYGLRNGLVTLRQDGWRKVLAGITTVDEVTRITKPDYL